MQPGRVVIYRERGRLALGVVTKPADATSSAVRFVGETDKPRSLPRDRIVFAGPWTLPADLPRAEREAELQELRARIEHHADGIDLEALWELLDDHDAGDLDWRELAEFVISPDDPLALAGVLAALWNGSVYFRERRGGTKGGGTFARRDAESVEALLRQQDQEREKRRAEQTFLDWVATRLARSDRSAAPDSADPSALPADGRPLLALIQGLALYGEGYEKRADAVRLLRQTDFEGRGQPWHVAFDLLVRLGVWHPDQELSVLRYHIPTRFSEQTMQAAASLPPFAATDLPSDERDACEDLTGLKTFTIDDEDTCEIDDALSLTEQDGAPVIGIHIADAGHFAHPGSLLDKSALARGTSLYLPSGTFPMLPPLVGEDKASLRAGALRPALSFFVQVDPAGRLHPLRITRSLVRVTRRLSYAEADRLMDDTDAAEYGPTLRRLADLANKRREQRLAHGAILIDADEVKVKAAGGHVSLSLLSHASPARALVSECMIMANEAAARYCETHDLPALYSSQAPPDDPLPDRSELPSRRSFVHAARRLMQPARLGTTPEAHAALGGPVYTQATSPLRRYTDLQMHHQIKHHLACGAALFSHGQLQVVAASAQAAIVDARRCERESTRYWELRWLEGQRGRTVDAEVVRIQHRRLLIELDETLLVVPLNNAPAVPLGTPVRVTIDRVDARRDALAVKFVEAGR